MEILKEVQTFNCCGEFEGYRISINDLHVFICSMAGVTDAVLTNDANEYGYEKSVRFKRGDLTILIEQFIGNSDIGGDFIRCQCWHSDCNLRVNVEPRCIVQSYGQKIKIFLEEAKNASVSKVDPCDDCEPY